MTTSADAALQADIDQIEQHELRMQRVVRRALDAIRQKQNHAVGINSQMGSSCSFVTSVDLSWAAEHIRFASELTLFKEHREKDGTIRVDQRSQKLIQQRSLDWRRQYPMTFYLAGLQNHKFPPLLVVVTRPWVDNPDAKEWDSDGKALEDSLLSSPLDSSGEYVDLSFERVTGSILYAIDGQHRLMALRGLKDLVRDGHLHAKTATAGPAKSKDKLEVKNIIAMRENRISHADIQRLLNERIGIELIPAVMKGETRAEALRRLRSLFVHVNRNAAPLAKGEMALLDEDDGFIVVARETMVKHKLLGDFVLIKKGQLPENAKHITTLETLTVISTCYLEHKFPKWKPHKLTPKMPLRPDWDELCDGIEALSEFFDELARLESFNAVQLGAKAGTYRKPTSKKGKAHLLFRPMAQIALAGALGDLLGDGAAYPEWYWSKLREADKESKFQMDVADSPWYGSAWDHVAGKMRSGVGPQKLVKRLFLHLIDGGTAARATRERLRADFAKSRIVNPDADKAIDLTGAEVPTSDIKLPIPW